MLKYDDLQYEFYSVKKGDGSNKNEAHKVNDIYIYKCL